MHILNLGRRVMKKFGLLGMSLSHSISPFIHKIISKKLKLDTSYSIFEVEDDEVGNFVNGLRKKDISGINITIPYKEKVIPYLDELDPLAKRIGAVNVIKVVDEKLIGYNTDYYGIEKTLGRYGDLSEKSIAVLGFGGASKTLTTYLKDRGAGKIHVATRRDELIGKSFIEESTEIFFESYDGFFDRPFYGMINTTPVGMYPSITETPVDDYKKLKIDFAVDFIYNPQITRFLSDCKTMNIEVQNGLKMLVFQAIQSVEIWHGIEIDEHMKYEIHLDVVNSLYHAENQGSRKSERDSIFLVGLPGCGKTDFGGYLAKKLDYSFIDLDRYIEKKFNINISKAFELGEDYFRNLERLAIDEVSTLKNTVISTGGGVIKTEEVRNILIDKKNVIYITRPCETIMNEVDHSERPLLRANPEKIYKLFEEREPYYKEVSNYTINNESTFEDLYLQILRYII